MSISSNSQPEIPNYKILTKISEGGMATVYLAIQENLDREVALKIMSPAFVADKILRESFTKEGKIIASLSHPHIITIHDIGMANNHYYMAMEYMPGETLKEKISEGLTTDQSVMIVKQLAKALGYAHYRDFIHRDIKPGNVLFRHPAHAILTDFGVAKAKKTTSDLTRLGYMVGTPHYMSPEQASGKKMDHRSDLYSLGVLFYEMLTQYKPYTADDTMAIAYKHVNDAIPPLPMELQHLQGVLDLLLAKDPRDRYQNAREFISGLDETQNSATRIMPARNIPNNLKKQNTNNSETKQPATPETKKISFFSSLLRSFKLAGQNGTVTRSKQDKELEYTIRRMQQRQEQLESQLQLHKDSAEELKYELKKAKRNTRAISKKTLSRLDQLDNQIKPEKVKKAIKTVNQTHVTVDTVSSTELPPIEDDLTREYRPTKQNNLYTKPLDDPGYKFPKIEKTLKANSPQICFLSPEIMGKGKKLITVEKAASILLLGQLKNAESADRIEINNQLCRTATGGYFSLKLHLNQKADTNLAVGITSGNEETVTVTHKLRQMSFKNESNKNTYAQTLTSMHNHALIIGNTHYEQFDDTPESTIDAHRLNKIFSSNYQYQTSLLLNATNQDILESLNAIYSKFSKDDTLVIFYSGQSSFSDTNNEGYWIPVDADKNNKDTWLPNSYLAEILQLFPAKHILIITDSCFSAAQKQNIRFKKLLSGSGKTTNNRSKSSGIVIASGCSSPQASSDKKSRYSLFGGGLIGALESADSIMGSKELTSELKSHCNKFLSDKKNKPKIVYSVLNGHKQKDSEFFLVPSRKAN